MSGAAELCERRAVQTTTFPDTDPRAGDGLSDTGANVPDDRPAEPYALTVAEQRLC